MVANTPRDTSRAITSLARTPNFSARSFTLVPSVTVISRVIGNGSFETLMRGGGTKPFIGPSFTPRGTERWPGRRPGPPGLPGGRPGAGAAPPGPTPNGRGPKPGRDHAHIPGRGLVGCIGLRPA